MRLAAGTQESLSSIAMRTLPRARPRRLRWVAALATLTLATVTVAQAQGWRVEIRPSANVEANLDWSVRAPHLRACEWLVYTACPPELPSQHVGSTTVTPAGHRIRELSPLARTVWSIRAPATAATATGFAMRATHALTLFERHLVPAPASDAPLDSALDRAACLRPGPTLDFRAPAFTAWLARTGLPGGGDAVAQARRVFHYLRDHYRYRFTPGEDRRASTLCRTDHTDCGGMCVLFVSALRAAGVPARLLVGRWAASAVPGATLSGAEYSQYHVKCEFYAGGVGWVPVDPSSSVLHDTSTAGELFFGHDRGDFITFHVDPDVVLDSVHFGIHATPWLQENLYWVTGRGTLDDARIAQRWTVR